VTDYASFIKERLDLSQIVDPPVRDLYPDRRRRRDCTTGEQDKQDEEGEQGRSFTGHAMLRRRGGWLRYLGK